MKLSINQTVWAMRILLVVLALVVAAIVLTRIPAVWHYYYHDEPVTEIRS